MKSSLTPKVYFPKIFRGYPYLLLHWIRLQIKLNFRSFVVGLVATVIGIIAFGILVKLSWQIWGYVVQKLVERGYPPGTEYLLGIILLIIAVWLGVVELKKPRLT